MRFAFLSLALLSTQPLAAATYPKIFIEYGSDVDAQACFICNQDRTLCQPAPIPQSVVDEAVSTLPSFQALWAANENDLLGTAADLAGKSFSRKEETVSLYTCPYLKGEAEPILIPIANFLNSTTQGHPYDRLYFVGLTMHELLHRYVDSALGGMNPVTPLLTKYENEPDLVKRHLHVDALQKATYVRLGRLNEIEAIIQNDSAHFGPAYQRAWEIVNDEGFEPFVEELRN